MKSALSSYPAQVVELEKLDYRIPVWESGELQERPCPLCDSEDRLPQFRRPDQLVVHRCRRCDLHYVSPAPSESHLNRFYSEYWVKHKGGGEFPSNRKVADAISREYETQVPFVELESFIDFRGKNILDVGFGSGMFLYTAKKKGANVFGVDYDADAVDCARHVLELSDVVQGDIFHYSVESPMRYDLIVMNDFFEHPLEIGSVLRHAMELVAPEGFLAVLTPNGTTFSRDDSPVGLRVDLEHMQYLTRGTLHFLLRQYPGWEIAHYEEVGFPYLATREKPLSRVKQTVITLLKLMIPPFLLRIVRDGILAHGRRERSGSYHLFAVLRKPALLAEPEFALDGMG